MKCGVIPLKRKPRLRWGTVDYVGLGVYHPAQATTRLHSTRNSGTSKLAALSGIGHRWDAATGNVR